MQNEHAVIGAWTGSAPYWEKHREIIREMFAPVAQALIEDARIGRGNAVLDIATGPGEPALDVAAFVGPEGRVVGTDLVPEMVAAARRSAERAAVGNTQFEVAPAERLPFPTGTFDAVISRFGVMFFPAPVDAIRETLRVLKPGKKLALAVWHRAEENPFFYTMSRAVERFVTSTPPAPDAPDAFRFASPGKLRDIFAEAGAMSPTEHALQFTIRAPISPEEFWKLRCEMSEKYREAFAKLSGAQVAELKRDALNALAAYYVDGGMSFPAEVLIVSGAKSNSA
jgi:ubiquinone/menaquinone biosynthesis C-methylase UbiE